MFDAVAAQATQAVAEPLPAGVLPSTARVFRPRACPDRSSIGFDISAYKPLNAQTIVAYYTTITRALGPLPHHGEFRARGARRLLHHRRQPARAVARTGVAPRQRARGPAGRAPAQPLDALAQSDRGRHRLSRILRAGVPRHREQRARDPAH